MTVSNKVLVHPEKEEIIRRLLNGESVKEVEKWLKEKHPRRPRLHVSYMTLQKFRKDYLNLDGEVLDNIKETRKNMDASSEELEIKAILATSSAYQDKLNQIVSDKLDANRKILEMSILVSARMEYYFNIISSQEGTKLEKDKMFLELVNAQRGLMQDWKKYVDGVADQKIEHNININVINEQVNVLKSIVFEVLQALDPRLIPAFVEKLNARLEQTQYGTANYQSYQLGTPELNVIDALEIKEQ